MTIDAMAEVRKMRCLIDNGDCIIPIQPHHVRTRGAIGTVHENNIVPLCLFHHQELHQAGRDTFAKRHGEPINGQPLNLPMIAKRVWRRIHSQDFLEETE